MREQPEQYKFSVTQTHNGWRWELLRIKWTYRGASYYYETTALLDDQPVFGVEATEQAAIDEGRRVCREYLQAYEWREQRKEYSA